MTIDTEKLRALLAAATPGPWGWNLGALETMTDAGKGFPLNFYPDSVTVAESGTCYECRARPNDINMSEANAALIAAAVNALPELLDRVSRLQGTLVAVAEWWGGPEHHADDCPDGGNCPDCIMARSINDACADRVEPPCVACEDVEGLRAKLATAEAERLTLARALERSRVRWERGLQLEPEHNVYDIAARIVAEADAASKEVGRG